LGIYKKLNDLTDSIISEVKYKTEKIDVPFKTTCIVADSDPSNISYVKGIQKKAFLAGINIEVINLSPEIKNDEFLQVITNLNNDPSCFGIIIQNPIPVHLDKFRIFELIDYRKDLDGVTFFNQGRLFFGKPFIIPATAWAVDISLRYIAKMLNISLTGKNAVIAGRSVTVGKPALHLLLKNNLTCTVVHTATVDTPSISKNADIIVACCGVPELIDRNWVKNDAIVIDVGIHYKDDGSGKGKLCGDVKSDDVIDTLSLLTAVPGGIGSVTSALLFANALKSFFKIRYNEEIVFDFERV